MVKVLLLNMAPDLYKKILCWKALAKGREVLIFGKDMDYILDTKNHEFSEVPFSMYFQSLWLPI